jgi:ribosomal protein S18
MDQLVETIASRENCSKDKKDRNNLIKKLLMICDASPLSGQTRNECVKKNMEYHDDVCNLKRKKPLTIQVYELRKKHPFKGIKELCDEIKYKNPKLLKRFLGSLNKIIVNSEDVVTLSHKNYLTIKKDGGEGYETSYFNRATFTKITRVLWWAYAAEQTPEKWNRDVDLGDGDQFHEFYVNIDDDYSLKAVYKHNKKPFFEIPYIKATEEKMKLLIKNLQNMGVNVRQMPDPEMNIIRSNLNLK